MGRRNPRFYAGIIGLLLVVVALFAACAPNPRQQLISPNMVVLDEGQEFIPPTPTPEPKLTNLTEDQIYAGLPEAVESLMPGDVDKGQQLVTANGCTGCHQLEPKPGGAVPTWYDLADTAVARAQATGSGGPAAYLYTSIVDPNAYVVQDFTAGVMPQNYSKSLSNQDLADIISYLLTLQAK